MAVQKYPEYVLAEDMRDIGDAVRVWQLFYKDFLANRADQGRGYVPPARRSQQSGGVEELEDARDFRRWVWNQVKFTMEKIRKAYLQDVMPWGTNESWQNLDYARFASTCHRLMFGGIYGKHTVRKVGEMGTTQPDQPNSQVLCQVPAGRGRYNV